MCISREQGEDAVRVVERGTGPVSRVSTRAEFQRVPFSCALSRSFVVWFWFGKKRTGMKRSLLFAGGDRLKTNQTKHTRDHVNQVLDIVQKQKKLQIVQKQISANQSKHARDQVNHKLDIAQTQKKCEFPFNVNTPF